MSRRGRHGHGLTTIARLRMRDGPALVICLTCRAVGRPGLFTRLGIRDIIVGIGVAGGRGVDGRHRFRSRR